MKTITQKSDPHAAACGSENKNCYICISEESEGSFPDTLFETLPKEHSEYIGKCILNGLLVSNSDIQENSKIGTICTSNHSYRNALIYNDEKQEIKELNILLSKL